MRFILENDKSNVPDFYLEIFIYQQSPAKAEAKSTPASKLAKAAAVAAVAKAVVPETPETTKKVTPKKPTKATTKESSNKKSPPKAEKTTEKEETVIPPSLEKKKSGYRSFMMRDGPRALGSKEIPQVRVSWSPRFSFATKREKEAVRKNLWLRAMRISLSCYDSCQSTSRDRLTSNQ